MKHDWELDVFIQQDEDVISIFDYNQDSCCAVHNNNPMHDYEETKQQ